MGTHMLISFSVQNYRSIAEKQTLSMVAGSSAKSEESFTFESDNKMAPDLLYSVSLFGANASGKSNFILAMGFFKHFVAISAKDMQKNDTIDIIPNKLRTDFNDQPSEFEIIFIYNKHLYQYGFIVDQEKIIHEWLFVKPNNHKSRMRRLFERVFNDEDQSYEWEINPTHIRGQKELWKKSTRLNALFLSQAVQLNSEDLTPPFEWITQYLIIMPSLEHLPLSHTAEKFVELESRKPILSLLQSADIHIQDISVEDITHNFPDDMPVSLQEFILENKSKFKMRRIKSMHENDIGNLVEFDFGEESDGTIALFKLAVPMFDTLKKGCCLVVDELHNSLHPHLLDMVIRLFHNPDINKNKAQLLFTCHETLIIETSMHKDQIWFAERNNRSTEIFPLSDFKNNTRTSNFKKSYLTGRYGAIPKIEELAYS